MTFRVNDYTVILPDVKGVFLFNPNSATGKTFLVRLLQAYKALGNNDINVISYVDDDFDYTKRIKSEAKVIFVDDFDMFYTTGLLEVLSSIDATILIVLKSMNKARKYLSGFADINVTSDLIEVTTIVNGF